MKIRDFKIEDLENNSAFERLSDVQKVALVNGIKGHADTAWTLEHNGEIIGSAGFISPWGGCAEGWGFFSNLIHKYPLSFHKSMLKMLPVVEKKYGFVRIHALCVDGFDMAVKWLEHLGFEKEATLRKAGPEGQTMIGMARIR